MKVVLVDDDRIVSTSLKVILEGDSDITVQAVGKDGADAVRLYRECLPDILLMDIRMPQQNGIEAGEQILAEFPDARILYLTTFTDDEYITRALQIGAKGYILKQDYESIIPSLKAVLGGQNVFGGQVIDRLPTLLPYAGQGAKNGGSPAVSGQKADYAQLGLTEREFELLELIADGLNNKEIANRLCLSEGTVRNYLSSLLDKLDLRDRTQLAVFYYQRLR